MSDITMILLGLCATLVYTITLNQICMTVEKCHQIRFGNLKKESEAK